MLEQVAEVIQVIPQEPISERTVEQTVDVPLAQCIGMIVDVPVVKRRQRQYPHREVHVPVVMLPQTTEILQAQVQQRTVELGHQSQLTLASIQKELETNEVSERSAALSRHKLIRTTPRGSEHTDELKPDCTNSSSAHADRAAAREQQIQSLKERVQQQSLEQIVNVLVERDRQVPTVQNVEKHLRSQRPGTPKRSWLCQSCANAKNESSRPPR